MAATMMMAMFTAIKVAIPSIAESTLEKVALVTSTVALMLSAVKEQDSYRSKRRRVDRGLRINVLHFGFSLQPHAISQVSLHTCFIHKFKDSSIQSP